MACREFMDETNCAWLIIEIPPQFLQGRPRESLASPTPLSSWLVFEGDVERRRLSPVPPSWWEADDLQLCRWLAEAKTVAAGERRC
jgi:hypothetical protein